MTTQPLNRAKLDYTRWLYGRALIERLRNTGLSLTEVSRLVKQHGDTPGWAAAAMEHRSVMSERDILIMERKLVPKADRKGVQIGDSYLSADQKKQFKKLLLRLQDFHGWSARQIADALGYGTPGAVTQAMRTGQGTVSKLTALTHLINDVERTVEESDEPANKDMLKSPPPEEPARPRLIEGPPAEARKSKPDLVIPLRRTPPADSPPPATSLDEQLAAVRERGLAFLESLMLLEEHLPLFARPVLQEYEKKVEQIITEFGSRA